MRDLFKTTTISVFPFLHTLYCFIWLLDFLFANLSNIKSIFIDIIPGTWFLRTTAVRMRTATMQVLLECLPFSVWGTLSTHSSPVKTSTWWLRAMGRSIRTGPLSDSKRFSLSLEFLVSFSPFLNQNQFLYEGVTCKVSQS